MNIKDPKNSVRNEPFGEEAENTHIEEHSAGQPNHDSGKEGQSPSEEEDREPEVPKKTKSGPKTKKKVKPVEKEDIVSSPAENVSEDVAGDEVTEESVPESTEESSPVPLADAIAGHPEKRG